MRRFDQHLSFWAGSCGDFFLDGQLLNLSEFQKRLNFTFFKVIQFEDKKILQKVLKASKQQQVLEEQRQMGLKFRKEIQEGYFEESEVNYIPKIQGYGLFARKKILSSQFIGEYVGQIREKTFFSYSDYLYRYPVLDPLGIPFLIDARHGNLMRFANHAKNGNMTPYISFLDPFYHVIFLANKTILPGEQLLYDYGDNYWFTRRIPEIF